MTPAGWGRRRRRLRSWPSPYRPRQDLSSPKALQSPYPGDVRSRYDLDLPDIEALLEAEPAYRARQVWRGLYEHGLAPEDLTDLPKSLRERLASIQDLRPALEPVVDRTTDGGETQKWLWSLHDGAKVETVLMHYGDRSTVCVSSQAGCAMACGFCATGQAGFERNLSTGEIVEQVVRAKAAAAPRRLSNVVFMGMGEPMANYDRMWAAVERIHHGLGISARSITVSTVGIIPGIRRLANESLPVTLAVSLHAANDRLRDELVPINRRYPIEDLIEACAEYLRAKHRRMSFEWALIDGTNDSDKDATELAGLANRLRAHVNLIPLNPTPGYPTKGSSPQRVREFRDVLVSHGVNTTIRHTRGVDIDAACGQLRANNEVLISAGRPARAPERLPD